MPKILLLMFHLDDAKSRANRALTQGGRVEVVDVQGLHPDGVIDLDA